MKALGILVSCAVLLSMVLSTNSFAQSDTCVPDAQFVADVTVPDDTVFKPGEAFEKIWRLKNSGKCEWPKGVKLAWVEGETLGAPKIQPPGEAVASGATVDVAVKMQAPMQPGTYTSWWRLQDAGGVTFGQKFYVRIVVAGEDAVAEPASTAVQTLAGPGAGSASELPGWLVWEARNPDTTKVTYDIYVSKLDGSDTRVLWQWGRQPRIREYDGRVVFNGDGQGVDVLSAINLDGSGLKPIGQFGEDAHPYWSPAGDRLVFDSLTQSNKRDEPPIWTIWQQGNLDTQGSREPVRVADRGAVGRWPIWLDNDWIVYTGCNFWAGGGSCGLFTVPSWGGDEARQITTTPSDMATDATGELIAFSCNPNGNWDICTINFDGSNLQNLTADAAGNEGLATFSPDGSKIAFLSDRGGSWAVWAMNADGSQPFKCFDLPGSMADDWLEERMSWGP